MVNNYVKILGRIKTPTAQPGAVLRQEHITFDDTNTSDCARALAEATQVRDRFRADGLIPTMSLHRRCHHIGASDPGMPLVGESRDLEN